MKRKVEAEGGGFVEREAVWKITNNQSIKIDVTFWLYAHLFREGDRNTFAFLKIGFFGV